MQHRESDMSKFFSHENQPFLLHYLTRENCVLERNLICLKFWCMIFTVNLLILRIHTRLLDGAAVVHLLPTVSVATFDEYADKIFLPHISKQLESCTRVDIVWDIYIPNSIKQSTREKRGKGIRRKVEGKNKLSGKWAGFLRDATKK